MFKSNTLFIIGAGASAEYGLPTAGALRPQISSCLNITNINAQKGQTGERKILDAFQLISRDYRDLILAGRIISSAMPDSISIDNFIDAHSDNINIKRAGTLAIAKCILDAEYESNIFKFDDKNSGFDYADTWIRTFFKLASENISKNNVDTIFDKTSFIVFNYDRCITHYLKYLLINYYNISDGHATNIINRMNILHPYGSIGSLPWQAKPDPMPFGAHGEDLTPQLLLTSSHLISTFTDSSSRSETTDRINEMVYKSKNIVFLGFSFGEQNMDLLIKPTTGIGKSVFGTILQLPVSRRDKAIQILKFRLKEINPESITFAGFGCQYLLSEYGSALTA
jgi:hypothetical protein